MTDITEAQTMEYFISGAKKAKSAARELASLNETTAWTKVRSQLGQLEKLAQKIFTEKPQTRLQTLTLANQIQADSKAQEAPRAPAASPKLIIH